MTTRKVRSSRPPRWWGFKKKEMWSCSELLRHVEMLLLCVKHQNGYKQIFCWGISADSPAPGEEPGFLPGQQDYLVLSATTSPNHCLPDSTVSVHLDSGRIYTYRGRIAELLCSGKSLHQCGVRETTQHWF